MKQRGDYNPRARIDRLDSASPRSIGGGEEDPHALGVHRFVSRGAGRLESPHGTSRVLAYLIIESAVESAKDADTIESPSLPPSLPPHVPSRPLALCRRHAAAG